MQANHRLSFLQIEDTPLSGVKLLRPKAYPDARGTFFEAWHRSRYEESGLISEFKQDNVVTSRRGVLRGLHFQYPRAQLKLVSVFFGEVFDVVVDIRRKSATYGRWFAHHLSSENRLQFWIEPGFAHGYQVLSDVAVLSYKCSHPYDPASDRAISWADPSIGIDWPLPDPMLSAKDASARPLSGFSDSEIFCD